MSKSFGVKYPFKVYFKNKIIDIVKLCIFDVQLKRQIIPERDVIF